MFGLTDLFQWDRFITPSIIKLFYWLSVVLSVLFGVTGILTGVTQLFINPIAGFITVTGSVFAILIGVIFARIIAEYVLIMFRINEHLGAIRNRGGM